MVKIPPEAGWALLAGAAFIWCAKRFMGNWIDALTASFNNWLLSRFSDGRLFWRASLRNYAGNLLREYDKVPVPFIEREDQRPTTRKIYVPLRTLDEYERRLADDAYARVRNSRRSIVLGPPGSGKSMLLRTSILSWAEGTKRGHLKRRRISWGRKYGKIHGEIIPVIVELHPCQPADGLTGLIKLIAESFASHQFSRTIRFVEHFLQRGKLTILFDGLDEVRTADRKAVCHLLINFSNRYPDCQIVVTCRTAIYQAQLSQLSPEVVRVADFDDAQIRRFLRNWKDKSGSFRAEQLFNVLQETPRLLQLARNPFLLTLMTYLFTYQSDVTRLPRTRAQFYREATTLLLQNKPELSYSAAAKIAILQRLALAAQDISDDNADRQVLPYTFVVTVIKGSLSSLGLRDDDTLPILDEIVNRSGLVKQIRGDQGFHFAHLTLQEFLIAAELADRPEELLKRYARDPSLWRETVKLWCGYVKAGSEKVIDTIFTQDPVLAFECLADAADVDDSLTVRIITFFQSRLGDAGSDNEAIYSAFGAVASDSGRRGKDLFSYLTGIARSVNDSRRLAAVRALAATKLPRAADEIADLNDTSGEIRQALVSMGDLAIFALSNQIARGYDYAIDDLAEIGTPAAVRELTGLIGTDDDIATRCAWRIGILIRNPDIEETLRDNDEITSPKGPRLDPVWEPFSARSSRAWQHVMGRVSYLINNSPGECIPVDPVIDGRMAVPLSAVAMFNWLRITKAVKIDRRDYPELEKEDKILLDKFAEDNFDELKKAQSENIRARPRITNTSLTDLALRLTSEGFRIFFPKILEFSEERKVYRILFQVCSDEFRRELISRAYKRRRAVTMKDWADSFLDADDPKGMRRFFWTFTVLLGSAIVTIAGIGAYQTLFGRSPWGPYWISISLLFSFPFWLMAAVGLKDNTRKSLIILFSVHSALIALYAFGVALHYIGRYGASSAIAACIVLTIVRLEIERRSRTIKNPLRGLLEIDEQARINRTSIIAGKPPGAS